MVKSRPKRWVKKHYYMSVKDIDSIPVEILKQFTMQTVDPKPPPPQKKKKKRSTLSNVAASINQIRALGHAITFM